MRAQPLEKGPDKATAQIPDKLYFRIGEVARLAGVKAYVLRYWEQEFRALAPRKSGTNRRLYRRKDVELVLEIKHLLHEKRYTIEGARKLLEAKPRARQAPPPPPPAEQSALFAPPPANALALVREELDAILELLGRE